MCAKLSLAAGVTIATAVVLCSLAFARLYSSRQRSCLLVRAAEAAGGLAAVASLAVAVTPGDRSLMLHVLFGQVAAGAMASAALLFAVGAARDGRFSPGVPAAWVVFALVLAALFAVRWWGPAITTDDGLVFHVVKQKVGALIILAVFLNQTDHGDRVIRRERAAPVA